jgi:ATP phosphoribosyltransferase regulatory subunit
MLIQDRWLLPEGVEEVFPEESERLEEACRATIDLFASWGYRQVIPPLIDYLDSLLIAAGPELDLQTFKLTDPVSGRLIGLRADMTPQVARIDARTAVAGIPARLCYVGSVLHTLSDPLETTRNPLQIGAELYGSEGAPAVIEIIRLMLETLEQAGLPEVHLDLGHVDLYRTLARQAGLTDLEEARLFEILQRKDATELNGFLEESSVANEVSEMIRALLSLNGPISILEEAGQRLAAAGEPIEVALQELAQIANELRRRAPGLSIHLDLAELRGYHYHTGVVFAAFAPGQGREIARGGRYDEIGKAFGQARPAVGFSADLKLLARLSQQVEPTNREAIFAPALQDETLDAMIREQRARGRVVIQALASGHETPANLGCTAEFRKQGDHWRVVDLEPIS